MSWCSQHLPAHACHGQFIAWRHGVLGREALAFLPRGLVAQRTFVPLRDGLPAARGHPSLTSWVGGLQLSIAAAVVAVQMGVDDVLKLSVFAIL